MRARGRAGDLDVVLCMARGGWEEPAGGREEGGRGRNRHLGTPFDQSGMFYFGGRPPSVRPSLPPSVLPLSFAPLCCRAR